MKAILTKKNLLEGIRTASHAIDARAVMPVLRHVLLSSEEGLTEEETWVRISGTDLQTVVSTVIPAQVLAPGEVTLPASVAAEIVGAFPEADVVLSSDDTGSQVRLECPPAEFNLVGLPPDEFPDLPEVPHDVWFEMDAGQLRAALRRTVFACSTDALRTILQGVLFNFVGHTLELAATDTFRLAVDTRVVPAGSGQARVVVPQRALLELLKIMPGQGSVRVHISGSQIKFRLPEATLVSVLIEGQFPNYERVIPTDLDRRWVIPTEPLTGALRRAGIVARQDMQRVVLRSRGEKVAVSARAGGVGEAYEEVVRIEEKRAVPFTRAGDVGEAYDEVDAARGGDDLEIAFNCGYLLDVLNVLEADEVTFEMSGALSPAVLRPVGQEGYLCVVMPMEKGEEC
jgi:DNA polymerase-3 subunit beta